MILAATGIGTIYVIGQPETNAVNVFQTTVRWTTAYYGLAIGTNLLSTGKACIRHRARGHHEPSVGLLAFRIWSVIRKTSQYRTSTSYASRMLATIVECGAVYSATLAAMLVAFSVGSNSAYFIIDIVSLSQTSSASFDNTRLVHRLAYRFPSHFT